MTAVAAFTHHVESLLDCVREGALLITAKLPELVSKSRDHIKLLIGEERGGPPPSSGSGEALIAAMEDLMGTASEFPDPTNLRREQNVQKVERNWRITFRPNADLLAYDGNPAALFGELRSLGLCEVIAHTEEVPALEALQADVCYLWWTATLQTSAGENAIRDVFIFVDDGSTLKIEELAGEQVETPAPVANSDGAHVESDSAPAVPAVRPKTVAKESTVRVPSERLDRLVNLVGQLVMTQSRLAQAASHHAAPEFTNPVQELERLVAELRDNVLGIRMLPIGTLFGRFRRLIHDLSAELGKEADLLMDGEETETG